MGGLDVVLIHDCILHGGTDLRMTENFLHLLNGHSLVDGTGCHGAAEFMRVDLVQIQLTPQLPQTDLHAADLQTVKGCVQCYKQRRVFIGAGAQICLLYTSDAADEL